ncbi:MAG: gamma carbonic anhydrase family protein [Clostridia bacterium]
MIRAYKNHYPVIHPQSYVSPECTVIGMVDIGKNCSIWPGAVLRGDVDRIIVKEGSNIQDGCIIHCSHGMETMIGKNCTIGHGAILHSCSIGEGSLVGMGAVLLDGSIVGKHCLIAAASLVTPGTVIPDGSLVMGSPGKVKRELSLDEISGMEENALEYLRLMQDCIIQEER